MHYPERRKLVGKAPSFLIFCALGVRISVGAAAEKEPKDNSLPMSVGTQVNQIMDDVAKIRGLEFKAPLSVENQSMADFEKYLDGELSKEMPEKRQANFGKIVKKVGLYRGPEIKDYKSLAKKVMTSQAAAYYDPETKTFYVLMTDMSPLMLGTVYAHELYHGLQDQYFNLDQYMLTREKGTLNDDETLARQSVVEGEATYIMTLWATKNLAGEIPDASTMEMTIRMQANMDTDMIRQMLRSEEMSGLELGDLDEAAKTMDELPPFIIDTLVGAYLKGLGFIFAVQQKGWDKVEELYTKRPPASTSQILHPEKWFAGEKPVKLKWPKFEEEPSLKDWEELDADCIGELQWRTIFNEFGLKRNAKSASAGWNGDAYSVFKRKRGDDLLLLLYTCWDTEAEAKEFADAYGKLLKTKYPDGKESLKMETAGKDVLVVEEDGVADTEALMNVLHHASKLP